MTILQGALALLIAGCLVAVLEDRRWYRWIRSRFHAKRYRQLKEISNLLRQAEEKKVSAQILSFDAHLTRRQTRQHRR